MAGDVFRLARLQWVMETRSRACLATTLLDQLLFEFIQLRAARGDPLMHLGVHHAPKRTSAPETAGEKSQNPHLPDDLRLRLPPTTSTSTPKTTHARPVTSTFTMHTAH